MKATGICVLLLCAATALLPARANAIEQFHADLRAREGSGSSATGSAVLSLDPDRGEVTYEISFSPLASPETGAQIHAADGSILHQLPTGSPKNGVWTGLGLAQIFQLRAGQLFILIHTEEDPAGELRGDIVAGRVPVQRHSMGRLKELYRKEQP